MEAKFAYLCSAFDGLEPHVVPMFFFYDMNNNKIFLLSSHRSKKVEILESNSSVSLTVDVRNQVNPFLNYGVMIQGTAIILDIEKYREIVEKLVNKYPKFVQMEKLETRLLYTPQDVVIKVKPELMVYWRGANFTRWKAS